VFEKVRAIQTRALRGDLCFLPPFIKDLSEVEVLDFAVIDFVPIVEIPGLA
jgi:hypothetical protein